ncbi:hypothetical protein ACIQWZ_36565 [Streptomyces sp. NPDC098077]|uniref:hypothetical protein n=1 Tax=Streptomyces sp. NPDC098077 TaxID=3366093 RepID=UPI003824B811
MEVAGGVRGLEGVAQQLAHAEGRGEAHDERSVAESLRIGADGDLQAGNAGGVSTEVDTVLVDESDDDGHPASRAQKLGKKCVCDRLIGTSELRLSLGQAAVPSARQAVSMGSVRPMRVRHR